MPRPSSTVVDCPTFATSLPRHHAADLSRERYMVPVADLKAEYDVNTQNVLGRGAHGVVMKAVHRNSKLPYAIKTRSKAGVPPHHLQYNRNEGELLTRDLHHENIVEAREYFETEECSFLVMEVAEHGDLLELVNKRSGVTELEAGLIALQLMDCLQYTHDRGIVHGDFKLENILITRATAEQAMRFGTEQRFALCDWGFAHAHTRGEISDRKFGSLRYQAPEIFTARDCSPRVDVWALGVVLYGMVCAALPFDGKNTAEIVENIKRCKYAFPEKVSTEFRAVISSILQLDAAARPTLAQLREFAWFNAAKQYKIRLAASVKPRSAPPSPVMSPKNQSRASFANSSTGSVSAMQAAHHGSLSRIVPSPRTSSAPTTRSSPSGSPPVFSTLAVKTQVSLPSPDISTSPPPSRLSMLSEHTSACWYLGDETA